MSQDMPRLTDRFDWTEPLMYYPAGHDRCVICQEPEMPAIACYPDVANPPEHLTVCLDCLSGYGDWELFGELILEECQYAHEEIDPGYHVSVDFDMPDDWPFLYSPKYEPWDRVHVEYESSRGETPASRSPFETKTIPTMSIDSGPTLVIDGHEYEYDSYVPVSVEALEDRGSEYLREMAREPTYHERY